MVGSTPTTAAKAYRSLKTVESDEVPVVSEGADGIYVDTKEADIVANDPV